MKKLLTAIAALSVLAALFVAPAAVADEEPTIFDITRDRNFFDRNGDDFDILNVVLRVTKLKNAVDNPGDSLTVFAPNDRAFKNAAGAVCGPWAERSEWRATYCLYRTLGKSGLSDVVLNHVLPFEADSTTAVGAIGVGLDTLLGGGSQLTPQAGTGGAILDLEFGNQDVFGLGGGTAGIIAVDIFASNGVVHVVDTVLVP